MNLLVGQFWFVGVGIGSEGGNVVGYVVGLGEQVFVGQYLWVVYFVLCWDCQVVVVEQYLGEDVVVDFWFVVVGCLVVFDLGGVVVVVGQQVVGQVYVVGEGVCVLLWDIWLVGFLVEVVECGVLLCGILDLVGVFVDIVVVVVVWIGIGQDCFFGNCFEQVEFDYWWGDVGGKYCLWMYWFIVELVDMQDWFVQFDFGVVFEFYFQWFVVYLYFVFWGDVGNVDVL